MFRSVRWRLILNSLLITLVAIVAVGVVTLLLVGRYFLQQEQLYLAQRAETVLPIFVPLFRASQSDDLAQTVSLTAFFSDIRIELLNINLDVIADSGPREPGRPFIPGDGRIDTGRFELAIRDDGNLELVRKANIPETSSPFATEPSLLFSAESPITSISSASLTIPLQISGDIFGYLRLSEGPAAGEGVSRSIRSALIGGSITALIVAVLVGSVTAQQIVKPLSKLEHAASAMASDDLSARAPQGKLAEYNQLANQFNKMADQLSGNIERLKSERTVLKRMIADASHELRTPLTALKTFNTLLQDEVTTEMAQQLVHESDIQITQLDQMTTGLLDLSRLEARISGTEFMATDLGQTIARAVEALKPLADSRGQQIELALPEAPLIMQHNSGAMQQAIGNIVLNALKYSPKDSLVNVLLSAEPTIITISDQGQGISAETLPKIFDRFYRDPSQQSKGTGLGLAISKEIVTIHSGTISVTSEVGTGSIFKVLF